MKWINEKLYENYNLVGSIENNTIELYIEHNDKKKIIKTKHIPLIEVDNIDLDNVRMYFSNTIGKVKSKTLKQIKKLCGDLNEWDGINYNNKKECVCRHI